MERKNFLEWAETLFGSCDLGDARRTKRLVSYAALQAENPLASTSNVCEGESPEAQGAYRLLRNQSFTSEDIDRSTFATVAEQCEDRNLLLAIQDTTTITVSHLPLRAELKKKDSDFGYLVHSTLMYDFDKNDIIGIIDQKRWQREKDRPSRLKRKERAYETKESFKWQAAHERMKELLPEKNDIITVCDREGDIFEFIHYNESKYRYVIRCSWNRKTGENAYLWETLENAPKIGEYEIEIAQRGPGRNSSNKKRPGRKYRKAKFELRATPVTFFCPKNRKKNGIHSVRSNAIYLREIGDVKDPLIWRLLTSEDISCEAALRKVIKIYESRWLIEEYHKCWKSGCRVEERPFQSFSTIEIFMAISAHIASFLLQLKMTGIFSEEKTSPMSQEDWVCLHKNAYPKKSILEGPPTQRQVYEAIAKLGGFLDTKRTHIAGWQTLWKGYYRFQERLGAWKLAKIYFSRAGEKM